MKKLELKPKIYSYVRISTDAQILGSGIRRQIETAEKNAEKYALESGLEIDRDLSLKDIGKSAYRGKHISEGHLGEFLKLIHKGEVAKGSILLIEDFDRLSRQPINVSANTMFDIINSGVDIITLNDNKRYTAQKFDINDMLTCALKMSLAHEESEKKSQRGKENWGFKRAAIDRKKLTARCPAWLKLNKLTNEFDPDESKVKIIIRIFNDAINGLGADAISRQLNKEGISPFGKANGWHKSSVQKILSNRSVIGYFQPRKLVNGIRVDAGDEIKNYFPAILDNQLFSAAQGAISVRKKSGGGRKGESISNIFSKIAYCGYCGEKIYSVNKGKVSGSFLTCDSRKRSMGCIAIPWKYDSFEKSFLKFVEEIGFIAIEEMSDSNKTLEVELLAVNNEINELESKRKRDYLRLEGAEHSNEFIMEIIEGYSEQINILKKKEAKLKEDIVNKKHETASFNQSKKKILSELLEMQKADSDELFKLRAKISSEIISIVSAIYIYSGQEKSKYRGQVYPDMRFEDEETTRHVENSTHLSKIILTKKDYEKYISVGKNPNRRSDRSYVVCYKNNTYRFVGPDSIDLYKGGKFIRSI